MIANYKMQSICSPCGQFLGAEFLLDKNSTSNPVTDEKFVTLIKDYKSTIDFLNRLTNKVKNCLAFRNFFFNKKVFFNVEINHLWEEEVVSSIIKSNVVLSKYNIDLVAEITERDLDIDLVFLRSQIKILSDENVVIAADDMDLKADVRTTLAKEGLFQILKLEWDVGTHNLIKNFIDHNPRQKIVLERVEQLNDISELIYSSNIWGVQGFHFCKGIPVDI